MAKSFSLFPFQQLEASDSQAARADDPSQPLAGPLRPLPSTAGRGADLSEAALGPIDSLTGVPRGPLSSVELPGLGGSSPIKVALPAAVRDGITGSELDGVTPFLVSLDTDFYYALTGSLTTPTTTTAGTYPGPVLVTGSGTNISFNLTWDASVASAPKSFVDTLIATAGQIATCLSSKYAVTLNLQVGWGTLNNGALLNGALGASSSYIYSYGSGVTAYNVFRSKLANVSSGSVVDKATLAKAVPSGDPLSSTASVFFTGAEGKALGALPGNATAMDGFIGFANTGYQQTAGAGYDLAAVAIHEITEFMGRIMEQGVAVVLSTGVQTSAYTVMDLLHYSSSGVRMLTTKGGYLSADGSKKLGYLNSQSNGDAADWESPTTSKPNLGFDACNAFASTGANTVSNNDWFTMDALGWNLAPGSGLTISSTPNYVV